MESGLTNPPALIGTGAAKGVTSEESIPHTLLHEPSGELSLCTVAAESFRHGRDHSSTAASALAWAAKWIAAFELWMLGELSTAQFAGHRI